MQHPAQLRAEVGGDRPEICRSASSSILQIPALRQSDRNFSNGILSSSAAGFDEKGARGGGGAALLLEPAAALAAGGGRHGAAGANGLLTGGCCGVSASSSRMIAGAGSGTPCHWEQAVLWTEAEPWTAPAPPLHM